MKMTPEVSTCCGLSLKYGTIIIGVAQSILSFVSLVLSAAYAEHPHELVAMSDPSIVPDLHVLRCVLIIVAVFSGLQCVSSIMLIFGAETNRPLMLVPWLTLNPIALIAYAIVTLVAIIHHAETNKTAFIIGHLIMALIVSSIVSFKIVVVHSYFRHLKSLNF